MNTQFLSCEFEDMNEYHNLLTSRGHCRHCIDRRDLTHNRQKPLRRANPRRKQDVPAAVWALISNALASGKAKKGWFVTKEAIAEQMRIPEHFVAQAFRQLNQEGKLSRGVKHAPHDSRRDPWGGTDSGWAPTLYQIL